MTDQKNTFKPDYLCHPQCVAQDALVEQIEARARDADENVRLRAVLSEAGIAIEDGPHGITWKRGSDSAQSGGGHETS